MSQDIHLPKTQKNVQPQEIVKTTAGFFQFLNKNQKLVWVVIAGVFAFGLVWVGSSLLQEKKEKEVQTQYYQIEKEYLKKREGYEKAQAQEQEKIKNKATNDKKAKNEAVKKTEDKEESLPLPTGDYEKDYGPQVEALKKIAMESPSRRGGQLSTLLLSSIYLENNKLDLAKDVLEKNVQSSNSSLLHALLLNQLGTTYSNLNDCAQAIKVWDRILDQKKYSYLYKETLLRQGVCYENLKDYAMAEKKYLEASQKMSADQKSKDNFDISSLSMGDSETTKEAEHYLKELKMRKNLEN